MAVHTYIYTDACNQGITTQIISCCIIREKSRKEKEIRKRKTDHCDSQWRTMLVTATLQLKIQASASRFIKGHAIADDNLGIIPLRSKAHLIHQAVICLVFTLSIPCCSVQHDVAGIDPVFFEGMHACMRDTHTFV